MDLEIERKFLVKGNGWREKALRARKIRQGYIATKGSETVRARAYKTHGELTLKGASEGISRIEYEYNISRQDAEDIIESFCGDRVIEKQRFRLEIGDKLWEVDLFEGGNEGLVLAEVELEDEDESIESPQWIGPEVSQDERFRNIYLAKNPINQWRDEFEELFN